MDAQIEFKVRPDHAAVCNKVFLAIDAYPKGTRLTYATIARVTEVDWHTVAKCVQERIDRGVLSRDTSNLQDLIFEDPPACDTLCDAGLKAEREERLNFAHEIIDLHYEYC
jgi:hypothetical protein